MKSAAVFLLTLSFTQLAIFEAIFLCVIHKNKNTSGGVRANNVVGLHGCLDACRQDVQCSKGFDWDPSHNGCYLSKSDTRSDSTGVDHYSCTMTSGKIRDRAIFVCERHNDKTTLGGVRANNVVGLEDCKKACIHDVQCNKGFDWDRAHKGCYISKSDTLSDATGVDHYSCTKSVGNILDCAWKKSKNSHTLNGVRHVNIMTVEDCKKACLKDVQCNKGFDWDINQNGCYFSTSEDVKSGSSGVDHYTCPTLE